MFQPFEYFREEYVDKLLALRKFYLVTQSYKRGHDRLAASSQTPILVSAYDDMGLAKTHWNAVKEDQYSAIVRLDHEPHRIKFESMLQPDSKYRVFWAVVKDAADIERRVNARYKDNMRRYIDKNTNWRIEGSSGIRPSLQLVFGHLYIILKHANQTLRINFEEIEVA